MSIHLIGFSRQCHATKAFAPHRTAEMLLLETHVAELNSDHEQSDLRGLASRHRLGDALPTPPLCDLPATG
ncbi:hypothetical protein [Roseivivax lentus]|uniref:hypothetical protein n=1 Tax=Roseivivax lentus TaxID=633194 RepID=UPI0013566772|nr:hypothetical protein [Roseivivax lentus]